MTKYVMSSWKDSAREAAFVRWSNGSDDTLYFGGLTLEEKEYLEKHLDEADTELAKLYGKYHDNNEEVPHTIRFEEDVDDGGNDCFTCEAYWD